MDSEEEVPEQKTEEKQPPQEDEYAELIQLLKEA